MAVRLSEDKKWFVDENNNRWDAADYTEQEALKCSQSLENCFDCINCVNCKNCKKCFDCNKCEELDYFQKTIKKRRKRNSLKYEYKKGE